MDGNTDVGNTGRARGRKHKEESGFLSVHESLVALIIIQEIQRNIGSIGHCSNFYNSRLYKTQNRKEVWADPENVHAFVMEVRYLVSSTYITC